MLLENRNLTITFLPAGRTQSTILSKKDIGWNAADNKPCSSKWNNAQNRTQPQTIEEMNTLTNESAAAILLFEAVESKLTNQSELATPIELENQSSSTEQNSTAEGEQFINRPITPNYTIGIGRAKTGQLTKQRSN